MPGTVVAVAVYVPLVGFDRRAAHWAEDVLGLDTGLIFTGTILGLLVAYIVRFHALAYFAVEARMGQISPSLDDAARVLGADRARILADVHLPLLWPGLLTGALLVLVEVMKELPATALLRPLGGDTLAITVWDATKDSRFDAAALARAAHRARRPAAGDRARAPDRPRGLGIGRRPALTGRVTAPVIATC